MPALRYILDTDSVTHHQLGRPAIVQRIAQVAIGEAATTVITLYEQIRGRLAAINRQQSDEEVQQAFQRLQQTHSYFCRIPVVPFDSKAVAWYQQLLQQKIRIGTQDLRIAAIVLSHKAVLVTSNRRHFDLVPELRIEDWNR
ncbi:MAG: type II toxin-antitoxin system VapC family toxin [Candidatus Viridilinea halotolerans]|uniref:Type II toxin-antitoxin system VapC family toxin n=1 Tax=Candidatus Viridilinea halotolerans TaxID=2491704 RepID=A0A426U4J3_9CHLR|nr:MAG: type II toxin-antitoxin system VapC family toxin [Candidatus Viridilinea halotolerans]